MYNIHVLINKKIHTGYNIICAHDSCQSNRKIPCKHNIIGIYYRYLIVHHFLCRLFVQSGANHNIYLSFLVPPMIF